VKVSQNTPQNLILTHIPWIYGLAAIFVILMLFILGISSLIGGQILQGFGLISAGVVCLIASAFLVQRVQIILNAVDNTLTIRRGSYARKSEIKSHLDDIVGAELDEASPDITDDVATYRVVLNLKNDTGIREEPLTIDYKSGIRKPKRLISVINDWLENSRHKIN